MDYQRGDRVRITVEATFISRNQFGVATVQIDHLSSPIPISDHQIFEIISRRPIAVGDTVRHVHNELAHHQRMHVNAIVDGRAWCRSSGYDYIIEVDKLERVSDGLSVKGTTTIQDYTGRLTT